MASQEVLWPAAIVGSVATHVLFAAFLMLQTEPDPVEDQTKPEISMNMTTHEVAQSLAEAQEPESAELAASETKAADVGQGVMPRTDAVPLAVPNNTVAPTTVNPDIALPVSQPDDKVVQVLPDTDTLSAARFETTILGAEATSTERANKLDYRPEPAASTTISSAIVDTTELPQAVILTSAGMAASSLPVIQPAGDVVRTKDPESDNGSLLAASAAANTPDVLAPPTLLTGSASPKPEKAEITPTGGVARETAALETIGDRAKAALAWSGGGPSSIDPVSLAAIREFVAPGDVNTSDSHSGEVRDGIGSSLQAFDCTRIQAEFMPESGELRLTGHVPDDVDRASVLAAMQDHVGASIPVADNMLILPRPQCGALSGIAAVGLPQSNELLTNPRLVGETAHAREYGYAEGQTFSFEFTGTDYDAFIYVDYFDANGNVIHLAPNDYVPLSLTKADSVVQNVGKPLNITIGPPFGQEIAAAFAVTEPLSEEPRPIIEPAAEYLTWMRESVEDARSRSADFKGEWVYFFITTTPLAN